MLNIPVSIDDADLADFKDGFLTACPIPEDDEGNPKYTEIQWLRLKVKQFLFRKYRAGKEKKGAAAVVINENIVKIT